MEVLVAFVGGDGSGERRLLRNLVVTHVLLGVNSVFTSTTSQIIDRSRNDTYRHQRREGQTREKDDTPLQR